MNASVGGGVPAPLLQVLAYHVVPDQALTAAQLTDGQQLPTLDGSETVTVRDGRQGRPMLKLAPASSSPLLLLLSTPSGHLILVLSGLSQPALAAWLPSTATAGPDGGF